MTKKRQPVPLWVDSPRNSDCGISLRRLDFSRWYTDTSFGNFYLHVAGPDDSWHRVYCRSLHEPPRLGMRDGRLYWIVDGGAA
jgi:hypothetical protein